MSSPLRSNDSSIVRRTSVLTAADTATLAQNGFRHSTMSSWFTIVPPLWTWMLTVCMMVLMTSIGSFRSSKRWQDSADWLKTNKSRVLSMLISDTSFNVEQTEEQICCDTISFKNDAQTKIRRQIKKCRDRLERISNLGRYHFIHNNDFTVSACLHVINLETTTFVIIRGRSQLPLREPCSHPKTNRLTCMGH